MITVTNFQSGELKIDGDAGPSLRLSREAASRLIMSARMHSVAHFVQKLPQLITEPVLLQNLLSLFEQAQGSARWNLKERFARLRTLTKDYQPSHPEQVVESIVLRLS